MDDAVRFITNSQFTETTRGSIPHLKWNGLSLPVKIERVMRTTGDKAGHWEAVVAKEGSLPTPLRFGSHYVYALPGGGEVIA